MQPVDGGAARMPPVARPVRLGLLAALALTVAAYAPALANPLVYDDVPLIERNALLRTPAGLTAFWTHAVLTSDPIWPHHYRPLLMSTFWLGYQLHGAAPLGARAVNLALHLGNGLLAFFVLRRLLARRRPPAESERAAALGAAIFLLHPIQAIAVELLLKRNTSLCTLFMLATLLLYARAVAQPRPWRRRLGLATALLAGVAALLSKEDAVVLPLLVVLWARWLGVGRVRDALPFAVAPLLLALRVAPHEPATSALGYLAAQPLALARYLAMLVDVDRLAVAYDLEPAWTAGRALALLATALALVAFVVVARRRGPLAALAVVWALLLLAPSSSLVPIAPAMDEVRVYVAFLVGYGLCGLALGRLGDAIARRAAGLATARLLAWAPVLLLATLALVGDWRLDRLWGEPLALWAHAAARSPDSRIANRGLCEQLFVGDDHAAAAAQCRRAVALWPDDPYARYSLVGALAQLGRLDEATRVADEGVRRFPAAAPAWAARGHLAWLQDDHAAAVVAYRRALALDPLDDGVRLRLADTLLATGDRGGAQALLASFAGAPPGAAADRALLSQLAAKLGAP